MPASTENLDTVRQYLRAIERGVLSDVVPLFTPDVVIEQLPNRIYPHGIRATLSRATEAFENGRKLLSEQSYQINNAVVNGDSVAVEVLWTGALADLLEICHLAHKCDVTPPCFSPSEMARLPSSRTTTVSNPGETRAQLPFFSDARMF